MKIQVQLKDPDYTYWTPGQETMGLEDLEKVHDSIREWLRYSEYVTIEIDTDDGTARVIKPS